MKRLFKDVSILEIFVVLFFVGLFVFVGTVAEASNYRPPKQPERGAVEVIQNQQITDITTNRADQNQWQSNDQQQTANNAGNNQNLSMNYEDSPFRMLLGIGGGSLYTQDHSNMDCQKQVKPERDWFGLHKHGEVVEIDEECMRERRALRTVEAFIALGRDDLALRYLCSEKGLNCLPDALYSGGDKEQQIDPEYVKSLERELGEWRKQAIHGDLYK